MFVEPATSAVYAVCVCVLLVVAMSGHSGYGGGSSWRGQEWQDDPSKHDGQGAWDDGWSGHVDHDAERSGRGLATGAAKNLCGPDLDQLVGLGPSRRPLRA